MKKDVFPQTLNTWIERKLAEGAAGRAELNHFVMRVYADPLRVYCLGTPGRYLGEPEEVVEGFFADRLGRADYFRGWKESGLRLRRWLMNGFGFYLKELRRERLQQSHEKPLEESSEPGEGDFAAGVETEMDRAFAVSIVRQALLDTRRACESKGQSRHWQLFYQHYYEGRGYAELVKEHLVEPARAAEMARTAATKFKRALRDLLAGDGALESEIDEEIENLLGICA